MNTALYLHIPYCKQACSYCDFYFTTHPGRNEAALVQALASEFRIRHTQFGHPAVDTLYIGGGTPSLLHPDSLAQLFAALGQAVHPGKLLECTLEANPDDCTPERIAAWSTLGISRLSLGIQSFQPQILAWMNRAHTADQAQQALELVAASGLAFSVDLIFAVPGRDMARLRQDVELLLAYQPLHISIYGLTVERKTLLHHWVSTGHTQLDEQQYVAEYTWLHHRLSAAGYVHYELSSYAQPGQEAVHNARYWAQRPYIGLGPSAHGYDGVRRRYENVRSLPRYLEALGRGQLAQTEEELDDEALFIEQLMTRLRTAGGLPFSIQHHPAWRRVHTARMAAWVDSGLFSVGPAAWHPTVDAWLILDRLIADLL
ncbi:MAG: radical SAM family heme chaperone HemW [Sphingobacteriia bacterium]